MGEEISIDCTGVEDELDVTMAQRSELDYLIYNDPLGYADLILNGDPEEIFEECGWKPWVRRLIPARSVRGHHSWLVQGGAYQPC